MITLGSVLIEPSSGNKLVITEILLNGYKAKTHSGYTVIFKSELQSYILS